MKYKKGGALGVILIVALLFLLVVFGIAMVFGSAVLNFVMDEVVPEFTSWGIVGSTNVSEAATFTLTPVNTVIQNFTWITGVIYVFGILGILGLSFALRGSANKWMIGFFLAGVFLLIVGCIFMSNIYEDIYDDNDEFAGIIQEHALLSFLILYSPAIMSILAFISGIILFSGASEEGIV